MTDQYIFAAAVDTILSGIYEFDAYCVTASDREQATERINEIDPWDDVSTAVENELIATAADFAVMDKTVADVLRDRYMEIDDA